MFDPGFNCEFEKAADATTVDMNFMCHVFGALM